MNTYLVSRRFYFSAAHLLPEYDGDCKFLHGHNYELVVTLQAAQRSDGMAVDFKLMKDVIKPVVDTLDHAYLNDFVPNPTAENILDWLYNLLHSKVKHLGWLYSLELQEGKDTTVFLMMEGEY